MNKSIDHNGSSRDNFIFDFKESDFKRYSNTKDALLISLGRKKFEILKKLGMFFEEYKHVTSNYLDNSFKYDNQDNKSSLELSSICPTFKRQVSIIPISSRQKNMIRMFKNKSSADRVIRLLKRIGGIQAVSTKHRFNCRNANKNFAILYAYNKKVEKLVLNTVKEMGIKLPNKMKYVMEFNKDCFIDQEVYDQLKVSCGLNIKTNLSDEKIKDMLTNKYSYLIANRLRKIIEMNEILPKEQQIQFDWNITRSKGKIRKIGIRATSKIVSLKEHENENIDYRGKWRKEYLEEHFGYGKYMGYDVRGSIYQISHLLNYGEWIGNWIDPYREMFGVEFESKADRNAYKSICMSLYFDNPNCIIPHNRLKTPESLERFGSDQIQGAIKEAERNMVEFTGRKLGSEIFLHESLLYIDFIYKLRKLGLDVVQIYDGFYYPESSKIDLENLLSETAIEYYQDYLGFQSSVMR